MIIQDKYQPARLGREILNTERRIQNGVSSCTPYPTSLFIIRCSVLEIIKSGSCTQSYMFKRVFIIILSLILNLNLHATILTVKQDGTGDYTQIQQAIDAAANGDTVLVWPGTYVENLYVENKNLTIGSLTLTTGDLAYLQQTIIDGNQTGSCFEIRNCQAGINVNGFTMESGSGSYCGGICGSGMYVRNTTLELYNCLIQNNKVTAYGGGIYCHTSDAFLSNVTVRNNYAYDRGGGIMLLSSSLEFDTVNRCNIYLNYASVGTDIYKLAIGGPPLHVVVDTFTVSNPDYYYLHSAGSMELPQDDITYSINAAKIATSYQDLYVATEGDNSNSGTTPDEPLKDISFALLKAASDSISPDTIHVANGMYSLSGGEKFPLSLKRDVSIRGTHRDSTILDAENQIFLLNGIIFADNYKISNLTLRNGNGDTISPYEFGGVMINVNRNSMFENILFSRNRGQGEGGGRIGSSNNFMLKNVEFNHNIGGGAIRTGQIQAVSPDPDTVRFEGCRIINNIPDYGMEYAAGGGVGVIGQSTHPLYNTTIFYNCLFIQNHLRDINNGYGANAVGTLDNANVYVVNCTLADNTSDNPEAKAIGVTYGSDVHVYNSIVYNNEFGPAYMFTLNGDFGEGHLSIYNSLIEGGEAAIDIASAYNYLNYSPTNIDTDPLFTGIGENPYQIDYSSPCIDAGTLELPSFIHLPETDLAGNPRIYGASIDMGAYEWNPTVGSNQIIIPEKEKILMVAPNPFSTDTRIMVKTNTACHMQLAIYNNSGQRVKVLMDGTSLAGSSIIHWHGEDEYNRSLPAGIYHVVFVVDGKEVEEMGVVKR